VDEYLDNILEAETDLKVGLLLYDNGQGRDFFCEEVDAVHRLAEVRVAKDERMAVKLQVLKQRQRARVN
jgi:hypothetical protein